MHLYEVNSTIQLYPIVNLRQHLSNTSLPSDLAKDENLPEGYHYVNSLPPPEYSPATHKPVQRTTPELTDGKWCLLYDIVELSADELAAQATNARENAKASREQAVAAIKVTTAAGNTFDGDETSQTRMARAILALSTGLAPSVTWVLADNSTVQATTAELTEALVLAGQAQAALWVL